MSVFKKITGCLVIAFFMTTNIPSAGFDQRVYASTTRAKAPAEAKGVKYSFIKGVKKLPQGIHYSQVKMNVNEIKSLINKLPKGQRNSDSVGSGNSQAADTSQNYGSLFSKDPQYLTLDSDSASKLKANPGDVYVDMTNKTAFKVLGQVEDSGGGKRIPVVTPELKDIMKEFKVPKQTIGLPKENIYTVNPYFSMQNASDSNSSSIMKADSGSDSISFSCDEIPLFASDTDANAKKDDVKNKADTSSTSQASDASGASNVKEDAPYDMPDGTDSSKDAFKDDHCNYGNSGGTDKKSVGLSLKNVKISIGNPKFVADADWNFDPLSYDHASFNMVAKISATATLEGTATLQKDIPILVYGYSVKLGEIGWAYIGIFIDIGIDGKIKMLVKVSSTGTLTNGVDVYGYMGMPLDVNPSGGYSPDSFDAGIEVDGETKAWIAATPQVGVQILGMDLIKLQIFVGFNGYCKFHLVAGTNTKTLGSMNIKLDFEVKISFWVIGFKMVPLDLDLPILTKDIVIGEDGTASAESPRLVNDKDFLCSQISVDRVDAYKNLVEGTITNKEGPYKSSSNAVTITVAHGDAESPKSIDTYKTGTDEKGRFSDKVPLALDDYVTVSVQDQNVSSVVYGSSPSIKALSPFDNLALSADAFNNRVSGSVSGTYADIDGKDGSKLLYNGAVNIEVLSNDGSVKKYSTKCKNGKFEKNNVPLTGYDSVTASIRPFKSRDEEIKVHAAPNLDALVLRMEGEAIVAHTNNQPVPEFNISGGIVNTAGSKAYTGKITMERNDAFAKLKTDEDSTVNKVKGVKGSSCFSFSNVMSLKNDDLGSYIWVFFTYKNIVKGASWYVDANPIRTPSLRTVIPDTVILQIDAHINPNPEEILGKAAQIEDERAGMLAP